MEVKVGLVGFGVIGSGVARLIKQNAEIMRNRSGVNIDLRRISDLDTKTDRGVDLGDTILTNDWKSIVEDDEIDIVIELIGGTTIAETVVRSALEAGKHVVTANKALLYEHGETLFKIAAQNKRYIRFEASVAGGIPIIKVITESLASDTIRSIYGIINGTTNYILTKMINEEWSFEEALKKAQELGFAEADPTLDVNGSDAAHKAVVLARIAFNAEINKEHVYRMGIENINLKDVLYAKELGYVVKLLAVAKKYEEGVSLRVCPTLLPENCALAAVSNEFNAVLLDSDFLGYSQYVGKGAGSHPTASAVVSDVNTLARIISYRKEYCSTTYAAFNKYETVPISKTSSRFYMRISTIERVGILSIITKILGSHNISVSSIIQKEIDEDKPIPIVILTHKALESDVRSAVAEIDMLDITKEKTMLMHIEDIEV